MIHLSLFLLLLLSLFLTFSFCLLFSYLFLLYVYPLCRLPIIFATISLFCRFFLGNSLLHPFLPLLPSTLPLSPPSLPISLNICKSSTPFPFQRQFGFCTYCRLQTCSIKSAGNCSHYGSKSRNDERDLVVRGYS